jgi:Bacterial conjugation TrbI-like protein
MPSRILRPLPLLFLLMAVSFLAAQTQDLEKTTPPNVIPQGTTFLIQLTDRLDTKTVKAGDRFHARLAEPLLAPTGALLLDQGKKIKGHVSAVEPGLRTRLLLSFDEMETQHGWTALIATVVGVPGEHGMQQVGEEGEIGRKAMTKEQIAEAVVVGASEGAAEGVQNKDKKQAATGASEGAAKSAFSVYESGHDLILDKSTALEIRLDRNLQVPAR